MILLPSNMGEVVNIEEVPTIGKKKKRHHDLQTNKKKNRYDFFLSSDFNYML